MNGDNERAVVLSEKLQQSKRKNAELRVQLASLESQLSQMTLRVQQLHSMHATSAADLVAQTKHAVEAAAARQAQEAEARFKHEASVARQVATEALDTERAFRHDMVRKVHTIEQMFPEEYAESRQQQQQNSGASQSASLDDVQSPSESQSRLSAFFEATRRALHSAHQLRREVLEAQTESRSLRARAPIDAELQYAVDKAGKNVAAKVVDLQEELLGSGERRSAFLLQRDDIIARVDDIEARMRAQQPSRAPAPALAPIPVSVATPSPPPAKVTFDERSMRGARSEERRQRAQQQPSNGPRRRDDDQRADDAALVAVRNADEQADRQVARAQAHNIESIDNRRWNETATNFDSDGHSDDQGNSYDEHQHDDSAATDEQCDIVPSLQVSARTRHGDV